MNLTKFDDELMTDYNLNNMFNESLSIKGLNFIRELIDHDINFSAGTIDFWGDAYIDATGRENTVDTGNTDATFDTNKYTTTASATSYIYHDIPAGTFNSTISSAIGIPFIADYETGINIQYKLTGTGGAEDTGWLNAGITPEVNSFTIFTAEPDTLIIKLEPKGASPTAGYPSIKGFVVRAT